MKIFVESDERCRRKKTQEHKSEVPIQPATAAELLLVLATASVKAIRCEVQGLYRLVGSISFLLHQSFQ